MRREPTAAERAEIERWERQRWRSQRCVREATVALAVAIQDRREALDHLDRIDQSLCVPDTEDTTPCES